MFVCYLNEATHSIYLVHYVALRDIFKVVCCNGTYDKFTFTPKALPFLSKDLQNIKLFLYGKRAERSTDSKNDKNVQKIHSTKYVT